ncbi:VTT domain-containing protein [Puniceicoccaceae bacterium K14]|nr:VTT domain-containing protein [Puniceicoccaceae bacterium K14]
MKILRWICRDEDKLKDTIEIFAERGPIVLLLCRASPILPEVSSCLAGATKMCFLRFLFYYGLATVPYAFVASRAGAMSSLEDPRPALFTAIGITGVLWFVWWRLAKSWKAQSVD